MTEEQQRIVDGLRSEGYLVIIWSPAELRDVDIGNAENRITELGNEVIEWMP